MGTDPSSAVLSLREAKVRAALLSKALRSDDPVCAADAARRFCALPAFAHHTPDARLARRELVRHKHALAVIALEQGHRSWPELKAALDATTPPVASPEAFFTRKVSPFLNRWFASYDEARASLESAGGYLFPFRGQVFVCEAGFLRALGLDPQDPDWARIGFDWVRPRDAAAHARLSERLVALGFFR